ncbi:MAG: glycosyltransferase family 39 protein, partial [Verrucomicrobiales bacterium]|nr:glycosyltransferase family 39 protein [Verrucomicrobiales bacterium]
MALKALLTRAQSLLSRITRGLPRTVLIGLLVLTVIRLLLAAIYEISPDEAYYTMWSERWDSSYYSKGPGIATALKLTTSIFGTNTFGVRVLAPLLALGSSLIVFRLSRALFDERVGTWAVVLLNLTPLFNAGALIMNIDPLSVFFWLAAMLSLWFALHKAEHLNRYWALTGLFIGLGFLAKYTNALQLLSIILLFALQQRWRANFRRPGLYILLGVFSLCTIPVLIWNHQHGWITVTHLQERGRLDESTGVSAAEFFEFVGAHVGVYSPLIFVGLVAALVTSTRQFFADRFQGYLVAFSLPIIALYFTLSWREAGEVNWTAPG